MNTQPAPNPTTDELFKALEHARGLFIYHAGQRLQGIRFYFIALAALGGVFAASQSTTPNTPQLFAGLIIAILAFVLTIIFLLLDRRNEELVHNNENSITEIETTITNRLGFKSFGSIAAGENAKRLTYSVLAPAMFIFFGVLSFIAAAFYAFQLCASVAS
ncbi:MAG: hypothetical protein AAFX09_08790 [Pseudomonadota bacterium]